MTFLVSRPGLAWPAHDLKVNASRREGMKALKTWNRLEILEASNAYWTSCTIHAAVTLDLFSTLEHHAGTAEEVARQLNVDERGLTTLLDALVALGLLSKQATHYRNTKASSTYLVTTSPQYQGYIIKHHHYLVEQWSRLDETIRQGTPARASREREQDELQSFLLGMCNLALPLAREVTPQLSLGGRTTLLDLGGGPGTWAIHFCLNHPEVTATVFDLPTTRPFAEQTIARFGMEERVHFHEGNYLRDSLGGPYDVLWLSHILHSEGPDQARLIVQKAVESLAPHGLIMIHDFYLDDEGTGPVMPALFALNMLTGTAKGRSYRAQTIMEFLIEAGIEQIERLDEQVPGPSSIVVGRRGH
jgi:predicted transcriptional regulator